MDTTALIGQDALVAGLQKQAAGQAAALSSAAGKSTDLNKVRDAAQKFEAFFIGQMMEHMTSGLETDETFGGGHGEDVWKSMLNQEYGKEVAKTGRLGITDQVMKGMLKMQEERTAAAHNTAAIDMPLSRNTLGAERDPSAQNFASQDAAIAIVAGSRAPARR